MPWAPNQAMASTSYASAGGHRLRLSGLQSRTHTIRLYTYPRIRPMSLRSTSLPSHTPSPEALTLIYLTLFVVTDVIHYKTAAGGSGRALGTATNDDAQY